MSTDTFIQAYAAGITDLLAEHSSGYQIQKAELSISEIADEDSLLPMLMLLAHAEVCQNTPGLTPMRLSYDKEALIDYRVANVPSETSLTRMLISTGTLLRSLATEAPMGKPIMLDSVYQDWHALILSDIARFIGSPRA
jgi:hypothetical protein